MCELLGASASVPVEVTYSLHAFAEHGGLIHPNKSGWGIAFQEGKDALLIKEPEPASDSPFVRFIETQPLTSTCVLAHVRCATAGAPSFANTHPFVRELGGHMHLFAHNGGFKDIWKKLPLKTRTFRPIGETDSEYAFCVLLERMAPLWLLTNGPPPLSERHKVVARTAAELRELGAANFLYSDGDALFAHSDERHWDEGGGRFSALRPPGLSMTTGQELLARGLKVEVPHRDARVLFVASVPLTNKGWTPIAEGTVLALRRGTEIAGMAA